MTKRDIDTVRRYLLPCEHSFWQWSGDGEVVTWVGGSTIVFREELHGVLDRLSSRGLPPLDAVLLLLAATRDNWTDENELFRVASAAAFEDTNWRLEDAFRDVFASLDRVHQLEPELRTGVEAKRELAEMVFENATDRASADDAKIVVDWLESDITELLDPDEPAPEPDNAVAVSLRMLRLGLDRVDASALALRLKTGLEAAPGPADVELPPGERVRKLLKDLLADEELAGLAQLAQRLMAAVSLPRAVNEYEELQVGGVSDITNRGTVDRLLLSELANDGLTLAVRVAMNEALYLRRETPPKTPPSHRAVLLDAGIRSWGAPRVFATAAALALTAVGEEGVELVAFRASGDTVLPVDLTTKDGIVEHLAALDSSLHFGGVLPQFMESAFEAELSANPVLILPEEAWEDPDFQRLMSEHVQGGVIAATVNRDGDFRLFAWTPSGAKLIKQATMDLKCLFESPNRAPLLDELDIQLPAVCTVTPFPIRTTHEIDPSRTWTVHNRGVLSILRDSRLMFWDDRERGARQIHLGVPPGPLWWASEAAHFDDVFAVVGYCDPRGQYLLRIDCGDYSCRIQRLKIDGGANEIVAHNGYLFAFSDSLVHVLDGTSGEVLRKENLPPDMIHLYGRFFLSDEGHAWYALAFDGARCTFELVHDETRPKSPSLIAMVERVGVDGPIGVVTDGSLFFTATEQVAHMRHEMKGRIQFHKASRDGANVVLTSSPTSAFPNGQMAIINVDSPSITKYSFIGELPLDPDYSDSVRTTAIRNRFTSIGVTYEGELVLMSRKNRRIVLEKNRRGDNLVLSDQKHEVDSRMQPFEPVECSELGRLRFARAAWEDGSEAFLDSRGLLHLRSSDTSVPEVSIVLCNLNAAVWCADGRVWGSTYFVNEDHYVELPDLYDATIRAFVERLR